MPSTEFRSMVRLWLLMILREIPGAAGLPPTDRQWPGRSGFPDAPPALFHLGDELLRGALSHGDSIVRAPDVDAYAAGRKLLRKGVDAFLQGRGRHIEAVIVGGIKVFQVKI